MFLARFHAREKEDKKLDTQTVKKSIYDSKKEYPEGVKTLISLVDSILEISQYSYESIYNKCNEQKENIDYIFNFIEYAITIRPNKRELLLNLLVSLSQDYSYSPKSFTPTVVREMLIHKGILEDDLEIGQLRPLDELLHMFPEGTIGRIIFDDDINMFVRLTTDGTFDPAMKIQIDEKSIIYKVAKQKEVTLMQLISFFGSIKCFKYCILDNYSIKGTEPYAIAGGNNEIIHGIEQHELKFKNCLDVAIRFHRNSVSDWLINLYQCESVSLIHSLECFNDTLFFFIFNNQNNDETALANILSIAVNYSDTPLINMLINQYNMTIDHKDRMGRTLTEAAVSNGYKHLTKQFMEMSNEDIEKKNPYGYTLAYLAAQNGHLEILNYLIEEKHARTDVKSNIGWTLAHVAAANNHVKVLEYLNSIGMSLDVKDRNGCTPLHLACIRGSFQAMEFLVERIPNIEERDNHGYTALLIAAQNGRLKIIKHLIEKKHVDITAKTNAGDSIIEIAVINDAVIVLDYLVRECHLSVNERYKDNGTLLHLAATKRSINAAKYLVQECHVDYINEEDSNGNTAEKIARLRHNNEIADYLAPKNEEKDVDVNIEEEEEEEEDQ